MVTHNKYVTRETDGKKTDRRYKRDRYSVRKETDRNRNKDPEREPDKGGEALMRKEGRKEKLSHEHNNYIAPYSYKNICEVLIECWRQLSME